MKKSVISKDFESPKPSVTLRDRRSGPGKLNSLIDDDTHSYEQNKTIIGNYVNSGYWKFVGNILVTNVSSVPVSIKKK